MAKTWAERGIELDERRAQLIQSLEQLLEGYETHVASFRCVLEAGSIFAIDSAPKPSDGDYVAPTVSEEDFLGRTASSQT